MYPVKQNLRLQLLKKHPNVNVMNYMKKRLHGNGELFLVHHHHLVKRIINILNGLVIKNVNGICNVNNIFNHQ
jgi:hypothetical protein